ncbi:LANO_0G08856g1_1 [Lachancea nothofagi CBS 11611]|uniref:LANO_0G08856g1_1 n=1 Tax=Lachancea nothofagi CBS 11611 TaxID=1266666 RepID=A0A1G4KI96_9SACH|nr:LANO_0G08856g1_1 [Lachancea nothofagi CBS 11611]
MSDATSMRRPVEITEFKAVISDLSDGELAKIRSELENSMRHLDRSNLRLKKYIATIEGKREDTPDGVDQEELDKVDENDLQLFEDSFHENEIVLRNHHERLEALDQEESYRASGSKKPPTAEAQQKAKARAASFDTDNTNGDANAANSVYL